MTDTTEKTQPTSLGWAIGGCIAAMLAGLLGGAMALSRRDFNGGGMCLLAAAVAAGLLANAILRR